MSTRADRNIPNNVHNALLNATNPSSTNVFITLDDLTNSDYKIYKYAVNQFVDLATVSPAPVEGDIARVYNPQGVWLLGSLKSEGAYTYLSGVWEYGSRSIQAEILNNDADIASIQLELTKDIWCIDARDDQNGDLIAPFDLTIDSITILIGSPTITILDDTLPYVLGATITQGSVIDITASVSSAFNLNITKV